MVETREPGGTPGAEAIRKLLLDGADDRWGAEAEALLFAAARTDHVDKLIRPALQAGQWVLSDRFVDSSLAYQGGAGGLGIDGGARHQRLRHRRMVSRPDAGAWSSTRASSARWRATAKGATGSGGDRPTIIKAVEAGFRALRRRSLIGCG